MNGTPESTVTPTCCGRPMTTIVVTHEDASRLTLHTCGCCGSHAWERDGIALDREAVLGIVRERIAEGIPRGVPAPRRRQVTLPLRVETGRGVETSPLSRGKALEIQDLLAGFSVQGGGEEKVRP